MLKTDLSATLLKILKKAFDDDNMSQRRVYKYHIGFQKGRKDIEDDTKSGTSATSLISAKVKKIKKFYKYVI